MASIKKQYEDMKVYSGTIMDKILSILTKQKIKYGEANNHSEIIIASKDQNKDSIKKLLDKKLDIPKNIVTTLIEIVEIEDSVYIRQKTK